MVFVGEVYKFLLSGLMGFNNWLRFYRRLQLIISRLCLLALLNVGVLLFLHVAEVF